RRATRQPLRVATPWLPRADRLGRDEADRARASRAPPLVPVRARGQAAEPGPWPGLAADVRDPRALRPQARAGLPRVIDGAQQGALRTPRIRDQQGDQHAARRPAAVADVARPQ